VGEAGAAGGGEEAEEEAEGAGGDDPGATGGIGGESVEEGVGRVAGGEADGRWFEVSEDGGVAAGEVVGGVDEGGPRGEMELGLGEGAEEVVLASPDGVEEGLVASEAFEAVALEGEGSLALPADVVRGVDGGDEDGAGDEGESRGDEEPAGVEDGIGESGEHGSGRGIGPGAACRPILRSGEAGAGVASADPPQRGGPWVAVANSDQGGESPSW